MRDMNSGSKDAHQSKDVEKAQQTKEIYYLKAVGYFQKNRKNFAKEQITYPI